MAKILTFYKHGFGTKYPLKIDMPNQTSVICLNRFCYGDLAVRKINVLLLTKLCLDIARKSFFAYNTWSCLSGYPSN